MDYLQKIIIDFELHNVDGIKTCFEYGIHPNQLFRGKPLIYELINMYTRGLSYTQNKLVCKNFIFQFIDVAYNGNRIFCLDEDMSIIVFEK